MFRQLMLALSLVALIAGLPGCGNKGDLYLPEESADTFYPADAAPQ